MPQLSRKVPGLTPELDGIMTKALADRDELYERPLHPYTQSLLSAIYPLLKEGYNLDFWQIGLLTFTFQVTASLLQPLIGAYADRKPRPYSLAAGMGFTLAGLLLLAFAGNYTLLLLAAGTLGGIFSTVVSIASLVTYPVLLALGVPPLSANMTNTVSLVLTGADGAFCAGGDVLKLIGDGTIDQAMVIAEC